MFNLTVFKERLTVVIVFVGSVVLKRGKISANNYFGSQQNATHDGDVTKILVANLSCATLSVLSDKRKRENNWRQ